MYPLIEIFQNLHSKTSHSQKSLIRIFSCNFPRNVHILILGIVWKEQDIVEIITASGRDLYNTKNKYTSHLILLYIQYVSQIHKQQKVLEIRVIAIKIVTHEPR